MKPNDDLMREIPAFKQGIPVKIRFYVLMAFVVVFQLSGGIYLASVSQMVGEKVLMQEDIMFAGYASFVGMTIIFPILFRLKFRFSSRVIFRTVTLGLIICNLVCMRTESLPMLIFACFVAGGLRMWGTFECFSSVQLRITPTRNFAVFFPVVYFVVLGSVQLSGILAVYQAYFFQWQYMHYLIIGLLLLVLLLSHVLLRPFHMAKPMPLYGIDWLGATLWALILLLIIFVFNYGEYFDWFYSPDIRFAAFAAFLLGLVNIHRMTYIRHPYIEVRTFRYPHVVTLLLLFGAMCLLLSTSNVLQNAYTAGVLHYDALNGNSLNWMVLAGVGLGALFSALALLRFHIRYKALTFIGFALIVAYQLFFYFLISPDTSKEMLYLPLICRGAGNVIIYVALTVYASQVVPFVHFFQALSIFGFIRSGIGSPIGTAIVGRLFKVLQKDNYLSLSSGLELQNPFIAHQSFAAVYSEVQRQALMVSIKEAFGYAALFGMLLLIAILCTRYSKIISYMRIPWMPAIRKLSETKLPPSKDCTSKTKHL